MVKNELSIRSQQSYKVAKKIAEHEINKINKEAQKTMFGYEKQINFKPLKQENELFVFGKQSLIENIKALLANSSLEAEATYLKNKFLLNKKEMSYVVIEKNSLNRENLIKYVSLKREEITRNENACRRNEFLLNWLNKEKQLEIEHNLHLDYSIIEATKDIEYCPFERKSYQDFYEETNANYANIKNQASEKLNELLPKISEIIDKAYEKTFAFEVKEEILSLYKRLKENYQQITQAQIDIIERNIDLQILKEQTKEGLDVADEIKENEDFVAEKQNSIATINEENVALEQRFKELVAQNNSNNIENFEIATVGDDSLLNDIKNSFALPLFETFDKIYSLVKEYLVQLCPFYYDYLDNQTKAYNEDNLLYRQENVASLPQELASLYLKDKFAYLSKVLGNSEANESLENALVEHKQRLLQIKQEFKDDLKAIKQGKIDRKNEYEAQKKAAKITLKTADGAKASEIREVLKLYKKEIKTGQFKRYLKAFKNNILKKQAEQKLYKNDVFKIENSEILVEEREYNQQVKANKSLKNREYRKLMASLNKEQKSAKYRHNFTTKSRENALGYTFLSVWAIGFLILTLVPIIYTILMVFSNSTWTAEKGYSTLISFDFTNGLQFPSWVGMQNFETLFMKNYTFLFTQIPTFFRNLLFFVPLVVFIGFVLAMLLNSKIKGRTIFRIIYFLPVVIVSGPVLNMLNNANSAGQSSIRLTLDGSSVAKMLSSISPTVLQYANEIFSNFVIILWMTGVPIVLFISALQKINKSLYEAAEIDGANKWQMLWTITFPLIKSVILIVCLFTIMQVATIDYGSVNPINGWINTAMGAPTPEYGVIAVGAWTQTLVVLLFVLVSFLLFREKEFISKDKNYEEIEEAKRKKQQRKAKLIEIFKVNEIKNFFTKVFAPITKAINASKEKKKLKKEEEGEE